MSPLEVATASFFHRHCNQQQQLFRSQYKRSNRTKGLKILRCFPHCCPEHIDRGYCGTSLSFLRSIALRAGVNSDGIKANSAFASALSRRDETISL
ncbi:uncharacterized protein KRP23_13547 [Phytophthora ramorum]|uniref:uncharacterized protein n=1 Tax=Phytophthora ramorum TaxID=164328 RepID=UPI0030B7C98F|nr:hypothetical protein KRP23_13547 [Phytophthora ramorum]